jgi:hypothetical protein
MHLYQENSSRVVPPIASSPPHRTRHAHLPFGFHFTVCGLAVTVRIPALCIQHADLLSIFNCWQLRSRKCYFSFAVFSTRDVSIRNTEFYKTVTLTAVIANKNVRLCFQFGTLKHIDCQSIFKFIRKFTLCWKLFKISSPVSCTNLHLRPFRIEPQAWCVCVCVCYF